VNCAVAMSIQSFRDLDVWQQGMALVERCYRETKAFPLDERFGLTAQLRRAAVSAPSNIAEGASRLTTPAFVNHLSVARGSLSELETCVEIALRLEYVAPEKAKELLQLAGTVGRLLNGLLRSLRGRER
jgi:four helix bundle protein